MKTPPEKVSTVNRVTLSRYRPDRLPQPKAFFAAELGRLSRRDRRGWWRGNCPFHDSKSGISFTFHKTSGAWVCWGCDRRGDLVGFVKQRYKLDFRGACKYLKCWDEDGAPVKVRPGPPVRYLVVDFNVDGVEHRAKIRDESTSELQLHRRLHAEAVARLGEIRQGDAEKFEGEEDAQWSILSASWELIQMEPNQ